MIFHGIENQSIELVIANYQYPNNSEGDWDGNWLNIYLKVKSKVGNWQTVDPSLTTWEVQRLINWLHKLSRVDQPEYLEMNFTEPNLSFEVVDYQSQQNKTLRIKFDLESRPKSASDDVKYFVDCLLSSSELSRIASDLEKELSKFPERKPVLGKRMRNSIKMLWWKFFRHD